MFAAPARLSTLSFCQVYRAAAGTAVSEISMFRCFATSRRRQPGAFRRSFVACSMPRALFDSAQRDCLLLPLFHAHQKIFSDFSAARVCRDVPRLIYRCRLSVLLAFLFRQASFHTDACDGRHASDAGSRRISWGEKLPLQPAEAIVDFTSRCCHFCSRYLTGPPSRRCSPPP